LVDSIAEKSRERARDAGVAPQHLECWRMIAAYLSLALFGLLVGFACVEVFLRVTDPQIEIFNPLHGFHEGDTQLGWRGKPNIRRRFHRQDFDVLVEHGPDGFRRPQPPPPEHADARVLFLGDSFTWGWGVAQGHVFTDWLQRAVGPRLAIDNRGVNAFGTAQEYLLLQQTLRERRYAKVAVMFYNNDVEDNVTRKEHRPLLELVDGRLVARNLPLPAHLESPVETFLDDHSRAVIFFSYQFTVLQQRIKGLGGAIPAPPTQGNIDYRTLPGYGVTARLLAEMRTLCQQHGAQFYVVDVPSRGDVRAQPADDAYVRAVHEMVTEVCGREGIPLIDLAPGFYSETQRGAQLFFSSDPHWNADAHRLAARLLLESPLFESLRAETSAPSREGK
jgi:lysophospholipase L1-like esterase